MLKLVVIFIVFLSGLYFCLNYEQAKLNEAFDNMENDNNERGHESGRGQGCH